MKTKRWIARLTSALFCAATALAGSASADVFANANWRSVLESVPGMTMSVSRQCQISCAQFSQTVVELTGPGGPGNTANAKQFVDLTWTTTGTIAGTALAVVPLGCYCNYGPTDLLVFAARDGNVVFLKRFHGGQINPVIIDNAFYTLSLYPLANESHAAQTGVAIARYTFRDGAFHLSSSTATTTKSAAYRKLSAAAAAQNHHVFSQRSQWIKWFPLPSH